MDVDVSHSERFKAEGMASTTCTAPDPNLVKTSDTFPELSHSVPCSAFHLQSSTHRKDVYWVSSATTLMEILCIKVVGGNRVRIQIFVLWS